MSERRLAPRRRSLYLPCCLAGALVFFTFGAADANAGIAHEGPRGVIAGVIAGLVAGLIGALFGLAVGAIIRAFPVHPMAFPAVGFIASPAVLAAVGAGREEGVLGVACIVGLVFGFIEWGAERHRQAAELDEAPVIRD
ncbi:MAG: hypothetical protein AAFZ65_01775 [Planctomycetota bacterium]